MGARVPRNFQANPYKGYTYAAIDYLVSGLRVTDNNITTPDVVLVLANGVTIGVDPSVDDQALLQGWMLLPGLDWERQRSSAAKCHSESDVLQSGGQT